MIKPIECDCCKGEGIPFLDNRGREAYWVYVPDGQDPAYLFSDGRIDFKVGGTKNDIHVPNDKEKYWCIKCFSIWFMLEFTGWKFVGDSRLDTMKRVLATKENDATDSAQR